MPCIRDNCPVQTKVFVPSSFDCSPTFLCGFCAASIKSDNQKTYSSAVTNSIRNEQQTRATLFAEVQQEQARKDAKKNEPRSERHQTVRFKNGRDSCPRAS